MSDPSDPSRDLLFGLLALQNGLIDQGALFAAFAAWTRDKGRPLADHLADGGGLDVDDRAAVEAMVARHLAKHGNDIEKSLAAIRAGRSTREGLTAIGDPAIETSLFHIGAGATRDDDETDQTASYSVGTATSDGLRFRILRPHAQGGLGAVFVALDGELNREVALKQILERHADDPGSRGRFLLEAEVTGGLEHPGIVPVYGLGTYSDGRPYYAMRFIKGDSLKEAIDRFHAGKSEAGDPGRRSLELRGLLKRFTDVCNAIEYAHSRGVLHRDIKPGNIIVGRHGETLVVDWGLAKATGKSDPSAPERTLMPSSASGSSETLPGSAMGTPAYMSPEQAEGNLEALGPRSDVYSLGATLYNLLTGRPPVTGDDVGAILRAVQRGEIVPLRQFDPSVDSALEAVCLKAMALRPDDRYVSCRALADDLDRWLADEPVTAWPEPLARRARRWARRNRTAVTAAAVALLASMVGLSAVLAVQTQAKAALAKSLKRETIARTDLAVTNTALTRSQAAVQARYDLALAAIQSFHTGVTEDFLLKQDQFKEVRDRLLKSASDFYGKLGALLGEESDPASRRAVWHANYELAVLTEKVGKPEDALAVHRQVLAARQALAAENKADPEINVDVGRSLTTVGSWLEATGRTGEAEMIYRKAETLLSTLAPTIANAAAARAVLARCRANLGWLLHSTGRNGEALSVYRLARADQEALAAAPGETAMSRWNLAFTINRVAILLAETGRLADAETEFRTALSMHQKVADDNPAVSQFRSDLANSHNNLGFLYSVAGRTSEAVAEYRKALAIQQKLADGYPAVSQFRNNLARSHANLGLLLSNTGKAPEAASEFSEALAIQQKLADDNPAVTDFRNNLASSHLDFGRLLSNLGQASEAANEYRAAMAIQQRLVNDNPAVPDFRNRLAGSHNGLGLLLADKGKSAAAANEYRAAASIQQKLVNENPAVPDFRNRLAGTSNNLGVVLSSMHETLAASAEFRKALAIRQRLVDENPSVSEYRSNLATSHHDLGFLLASSGKSSGAEAEYRKELAIRQRLADDNPAVMQLQRDLANSLLLVGWHLAHSGKTGEAVGYYTQEEAIRRKLAPASSVTPNDNDLLANCQANLADALRRSGRLDEALAACERSLAVRKPMLEAQPDVPNFRAGLAETYLRLGQVRCDLKDLAGAAAAWERACAQNHASYSLNADHTFVLACCHAGLAGLAGRPGSGVSAVEGTNQADMAMAGLRRAATMGFRNPDAYRTESALDPLRNRPDFRALMLDLVFPSEPFAQ